MARKVAQVASPATESPPPVPPSKSASKKATPNFVKYYLLGYNALSALGWSYIFILTLVHLLNLDGNSAAIPAAIAPSAGSTLSRRFVSFIPFIKSAPKIIATTTFESKLPAPLRPFYRRALTTFVRVGTTTALVQSLAILEIGHVLLGWVRSPLQTTVIQVFSRLFLVWGIVEQFPQVRVNPFFTSMVLSWSATEVIRYSFYAANLLGFEPPLLLYLRYTTFYVLYPTGAGSEAALIYASLPSSSPIPSWSAWARGLWRPTDYIRAALFLVWFPGLYVMYTHMIKQRAKVLGPNFTLRGNLLANGKPKTS